MTSEGHFGARLQRALAVGNLIAAEQAAFDVPFVPLADEIAVEGHPWPLEVVDLVWAPPGVRVAAIVQVRAAVLRAV